MSRSLKEATIEKKLTTGIILVCLFAALVAAAANYHFARQYLLQAVEKGQGSAWALTERGGSALLDGNLLWLSLTTVAGSALLVVAAFLLVCRIRGRSKVVDVNANKSPAHTPTPISPAAGPDDSRPRKGADRRIRELEKTIEKLRREVTERQQVEEALKLRGRYITAVAQIEQALLSRGESDNWMDTVLATLGEVSDASRCYLYRKQISEDGRHLATLIAEWCAPGIVPHRDDPLWCNIPYLEVGLERWHQLLSEDKPIAGRLESFPEKEKAAFESSDVRSLLALPLMVDGQLYGLVGFDECLTDRLWGSAEVEFLRSAARAISLAIERRQAVVALRESVEQYQSVFDTAASLIMSIDANGAIVDCNSRVKRILGYEPVDLIGQPLELIVPPAIHKQVYRYLQHAADHGCAYDRECQLIRKDGRVIDIVINASALTDSRGEYTRSLCIIEDITERKQADQALRDSEGILRATVEATADGILVVDEKGSVIHANRRFAELWHVPAELIQARDDRRLLHFVLDQLRDADTFLAKVKELYGTSIEDFDTLYFKDGRVFERFSCPLTRDGRTAGRVWSFRDVTERTERENEIRKLSAVVEQSPNMIMITDPSGCIEYVNPRFSEVTGYAPEEVLGHKPNLLNSGRNDPALYEELWRTIAGGRAWVGDIRNRRKDGGIYWEHKIITPVTDESGNLIYYLAVGEDVTEQLQAREMLAEGQKMSATGTLAAGVAHEFSNYLGGIIGNASHIIDEMNRDGGLLSVPESVQEISRLAEKANDIAVSLLSFSNARPEKAAPENLKKIITRTLRLVREKMRYDSVELTAHLDNVPPVIVSAGKIQHLLLNLLVNARQAIKGEGAVTVSLCDKHDHIEVRIGDTGSGIPPQNMSRIFDPFFSTRGVWGKDESPGIGIGLSICRNIAREYGGELTAESIEGCGSTFTLTLPVAPDDITDIAAGVFQNIKNLLVFTADKEISRAYTAAAAEINLHVTCTDNLAEFETDLPDIADLVVCDARFPAKGELYRLVTNCQQSAVPYIVINYGARDYQLEDIYDRALADYADIPDLCKLLNALPGCGREQKLT